MEVQSLHHETDPSLGQQDSENYSAKEIGGLFQDVDLSGIKSLSKMSNQCDGCYADLKSQNSRTKASHLLLGPCKNTEIGKLFLALMTRSERLAESLIDLCCKLNQLQECPHCDVKCRSFEDLLRIHLLAGDCPMAMRNDAVERNDGVKGTRTRRMKFPCTNRGCSRYGHDFGRSHNLKRHNETVHVVTLTEPPMQRRKRARY
ncbi:hypothetical protein IWW34DRAFT_770857 [Fusarium oxysporum f. sp. albedinis]|nr:hypothetical protein IWW34DRAFT_770857 [Fusarium oxysporum f. sp. albedinis]